MLALMMNQHVLDGVDRPRRESHSPDDSHDTTTLLLMNWHQPLHSKLAGLCVTGDEMPAGIVLVIGHFW